MKLRIRGNSIRFRVSQSELRDIVDRGYTADHIEFPPAAGLSYCVEVVPRGSLTADFSDERIRLRVPRDSILHWARAEEVSIRGEQLLGDGRALKILLEKDFSCLAPRDEEDDSDLFPNPHGGTT